MKRSAAAAFALLASVPAGAQVAGVDTETPCPDGMFEAPESFDRKQVAYCFLVRLNDDDDPTDAYGLLAADGALIEPDSLPYGGRFVGATELNERFVPAFFGAWERAVSRPQAIFEGPDGVVIDILFDVKSRRTGEEGQLRLMERYVMRNGRIAEIWPYYFDTVRAREMISGADVER